MTKKRMSITIEFLFVLFFTFYAILPAFSLYIKFYLMIFAAVAYVMLVMTKNKRSFTLKQMLVFIGVMLFVCLLYVIFVEPSSISENASNRSIKYFFSKLHQFIIMFLPLLLIDWAKNRANSFERKSAVVIGFLSFFYVMLKTTHELSRNPEIARNWLEFSQAGKNNAAGYFFVYAIPFLAAIFVYLFKNLDNIYLKILVAVGFFFEVYFLLISQYTLSVIITFIGVMYMLFTKIKNRGLKTVLFILLPIFIIILPPIIKFVATKVPSADMSVRLTEVYDFLVGNGEMGYNLNGRLTLYKRTIIAFFESPIWGNRSLPFDGHATLLTVLADLGLLGGIPFYYLFFKAKKAVTGILGKQRKEFTPFWIMLLIMGFTNPIHSSAAISFAVWFMVPLVMLELNKGEGE